MTKYLTNGDGIVTTREQDITGLPLGLQFQTEFKTINKNGVYPGGAHDLKGKSPSMPSYNEVTAHSKFSHRLFPSPT